MGSSLFVPDAALVKIRLAGKDILVPEKQILLRALQFLSPEGISYGRFCWNEDCQYCRVSYDTGEGTPRHTAISCKLLVQEGMRVHDLAQEIRYCLRNLKLDAADEEASKPARQAAGGSVA